MTENIDFFEDELRNFEDIARYIKPSSGDIPELQGIDIYGDTIPLNGIVGGDHIIYVDFKKRYDLDKRILDSIVINRKDVVERLKQNKTKAGILIADVSGHKITDALLAAMLHQSFLTGVMYELKQNGQVTTELFENINSRFYSSSSFSKFITMIYGEISKNGMFRFTNAGHPNPAVFSNKYDKLMEVSQKRVIHFPPIGTLPSREDLDFRKNLSRVGYKKKYSINEINLMGAGDILLLYTDGLSEHNINIEDFYFPKKLEIILKKVKKHNAKDIFNQITDDMLKFNKFSDDVSIVVIKKNL
jgi:serine phosphatase RsbU (regulator of sigma subunit)